MLDMDEISYTKEHSSLYIGDIDLILEKNITSTSSPGQEDGECVAAGVYIGSTFQSPLELYCELGLTN